MQKDREERKDVYGRTGVVVRRNVTFLVYKCPKGPAYTERGEASFEKGKDDITVKEAMAELQSERMQQRLAEDTEHTGVVHG